MKKILMASVASFALMIASAQAANQDITLNASVAAYCTLAGPAAVTLTMTDDADGTVSGTPATTLAVVCNAPSSVTLASANGAMESATAAPAGFDNFINYVAVATGGTAPVSLTTVNGGAQTTGATVYNTAGMAGNLTITVTPADGANPLVAAADYSDTLTVTIDPS